MNIKNSLSPLFHEYSFRERVFPSGLTRKGPNSSMAPYPRDEHPGPAHSNHHPHVLSLASGSEIGNF